MYPPSSRLLSAFALAVFLVVAPWAAMADEPPVAGPQIVLEPLVEPGASACPVHDPVAAFFPERETWLWVEGNEDDGVLAHAWFAPGASAPTSLGMDGAALPGLRVAQDGLHAYAAWPAGRLGWIVGEVAPSGPDVFSNVAFWIANPAARNVVRVGLAVTPSGRVLLAWTEAPAEPGGEALVYAVLLDAELREVTDRVLVARIPDDSEERWEVDVATLSEDPETGAASFVVGWRTRPPGRTAELAARPLLIVPEGDASLALEPGAPFRIDAPDEQPFFTGRPVTAPVFGETPGGGFVAAWINIRETDPPSSAAFLRRYGAAGQPLDDPQFLDLDGFFPSTESIGLAVDETGRIAVTFSSFERDFRGNRDQFFRPVYGQLLDSQGAPLGEVFRISELDARSDDRAHFDPRPFFDVDGDLVVLWTDRPVAQPPVPGFCPGGERVLGRRFEVGCGADDLCLLDERFEVTVTWTDPHNGGTGVGHGRRLTDDTGAFWFFDEANLELMVKVLDGRPVNDHYWVFFGSLTDVGFELTVHDRVTGAQRTYVNEPFTFASRGDTTAFPANP